MNVRQFPWAWIAVASIVGVDAVWLCLARISIPPLSLAVSFGIVGLMAGISAIYTHLRPDARLAALTGGAAHLLGFSISIGVFSYLMTTLDRPLIDDWLAGADRAAGFDWIAFYTWVWSNKAVSTVLICAYDSVIPQLGILMFILPSLREFRRARLLFWLYAASSFTYILIAGLLPAAGAFVYYSTALDTPYVQQFLALREGHMTVFSLFKAQGVVQFPSFHLALAVIATYVTFGMRRLFPVFLALNVLVLCATPPIGGHFLSDLWSSAILMAALIFVVERGLNAYDIAGR